MDDKLKKIIKNMSEKNIINYIENTYKTYRTCNILYKILKYSICYNKNTIDFVLIFFVDNNETWIKNAVRKSLSKWKILYKAFKCNNNFSEYKDINFSTRVLSIAIDTGFINVSELNSYWYNNVYFDKILNHCINIPMVLDILNVYKKNNIITDINVSYFIKFKNIISKALSYQSQGIYIFSKEYGIITEKMLEDIKHLYGGDIMQYDVDKIKKDIEEVKEKKYTCCICFDDITQELYTLNCFHRFHRKCIKNCILNKHVYCPNCRKKIKKSVRDIISNF